MSAILAALRRLVGNKGKIALLIGVFIIILCLLLFRPAHAAEVDLRAGSSFGPGKSGAVLGLQMYFPQGNDLDLFVGTLLWGGTSAVENNWSWQAGIRGCRWNFCASIGASYLQRIDSIDGSHTNYNLELCYLFGGKRWRSIDLTHLSNAGTILPNAGRNAALVSFRLQ